MARVGHRQVDAAQLVQAQVAHAASQIVADIAQQTRQQRGPHRALLDRERIGDLDRLHLRREERSEIALGEKAVVHDLVESLRDQRRARRGLDPRLGDDLGRLAHARLVDLDRDRVVAAQAGDLLDAVDLARQIAAPGGHAPEPPLGIAVERLELQRRQRTFDLFRPDFGAEDGRDARWPHPDARLRQWRRVAIDGARQYAAAGELYDQLRAAVGGECGRLLVHPALEAVRGFRVQAVPPRRAADSCGLEHRTF